MRYADKQKKLSRYEDGHHYDTGQRIVLIDASDKYILLVEGSRNGKNKDPNDPYQRSCIVAYPDNSSPDKQRILDTGRMTSMRWENLAPTIFEFLGCEPFDIKMINRNRTLVLDAPGTVDDSPLRRPMTVVKGPPEEGIVTKTAEAPQVIPLHVPHGGEKSLKEVLQAKLAEAEQMLFLAAQEYVKILALVQQTSGS